ncbi:MAG: hydroxyacid-oxoacid transhydrogenase [Polyangiales bacterium]
MFSIDASSIAFGPGVLREAGEALVGLGSRRVALFTDPRLRALPPFGTLHASLIGAGLEVVVYDDVEVEPTHLSFQKAAEFARQGKFDGYVSLGGGSVIDTCKAANLYATYPADFLAYVNAPVGEGRAVPGPLAPHLACPTTCGTGSECTGIAVFDHLELRAKTGIASRALRPSRALIDPTATETLPGMVVAASGFDVLCHALESFTARPYDKRVRPATAAARPMSQGRNAWSDIGSLEALRLTGRFIVRAVKDKQDWEARSQMSWAATLAGIAFGNSGVHLPHAMAYAVAGQVKEWHCPEYPGDEPLVPHGISVVVNAPSVFRATIAAAPERHAEAARALGSNVDLKASVNEVTDALSSILARLMRDSGVPNGTGALGYLPSDVPELTRGTMLQKRLLDNAPISVDNSVMQQLFEGAQSCW